MESLLLTLCMQVSLQPCAHGVKGRALFEPCLTTVQSCLPRVMDALPSENEPLPGLPLTGWGGGVLGPWLNTHSWTWAPNVLRKKMLGSHQRT